MTSFSDRRVRLALRALYYLAVLLAILATTSLRLTERPGFIYQGF